MNPSAIGIFDSGIGGLTVYKALRRLLPNENLIYLGDTARVPYGNKSVETVTRYSIENAQFLLKHDVKMIVVACNTASALALTALQKEIPVPVLGVIEPGSRGALAHTKTGRIGVIGTEATVRSGAYAAALRRLLPQAEVQSIPCPLFVPLVEEGWVQGPVVTEVIRKYLMSDATPPPMTLVDTLILGCTHYPLLKGAIQEVVGPGITLIDSAEETAKEVAQLLIQEKKSNASSSRGTSQFFVTDSPVRFRKVGEIFLGEALTSVDQVHWEV